MSDKQELKVGLCDYLLFYTDYLTYIEKQIFLVINVWMCFAFQACNIFFNQLPITVYETFIDPYEIFVVFHKSHARQEFSEDHGKNKMTPPSYFQWCYDSDMVFWRIPANVFF